MNRKEAKGAGLSRYTGKVCDSHPDKLGERLVCNSHCVECHVHRIRVREKVGGDKYAQKLKRNWNAKQRRKAAVFEHYGMVCALCGFSDMRALTIDHENQMGSNHKSLNGRRLTGEKLYRWLISNKFPPGFRTLCCNHQSIEFAIHEGRDNNNSGGMRAKYNKEGK